MKKFSVLAGLLLSLPCLASAQDALLQGFQKAQALPLIGQVQAMGEVEPGHGLGSVTGTDIDMKVYDHAVAGAVNGAVVWGFFDEAAGASKLTMRKYGQTISAEFKKQADNALGGVIASDQRATTVALAGVDAAARTFKLRINDEVVVVSISPEGVSNGHFVNPTYSTVIGGKSVSYRIEVTGCFGYSIYMSMVILGAYAH